MGKRNKTNAINIFIAVFISILTITMPIVFTALQPEVDLIKNAAKQNSVIDVLANSFTKIISFLDVIPNVAASDDVGCCEIMKNGAKCQISTMLECNSPQQWHFNQTCAAICQIGCCIDSQGMCSQNAIPSTCQTGTFIPNDANCTTNAICKKGCCTVGYQKFWATNLTCSKVHNGAWDGNIASEAECLEQAGQEQRGCCKSYGGCEYITGAECSNKAGIFFANMKCYQGIPGCEACIGRGQPKCLEGFSDLYNSDNCSNIYSDELNQSCGGGFCNPVNHACQSGICTNVTDSGYYESGNYNFESPGKNGRTRESGDSWCVYDTAEDFGKGTIPLGAYSVRRYCMYGEEYVEPCDSYRQTICLESKGICLAPAGSSIQKITDCSKRLASECSGDCYWQDTPRQGYCVPNLYASCVNITNKQDCEANSFCFWWTDLPVKDKNQNVVNLSAKDWIAFNRLPDGELQKQICLPRYSPGLDENNKNFVCAQGSFICTYSSAFFGIEQTNTECDYSEWYSAMAQRCRALGDCGTYKNYIGKTVTGTRIGEAEDLPQNISEIRVKREIPLPQDYIEFVNGLNISQQHQSVRGLRFFLSLGYALTVVSIAGKLGLFFGKAWLLGKGTFWWTGAASAAIAVTAIVAGIMILVYASGLPVGPGRAALESLGLGLISGGTAALLGASAATAGLIGLAAFLIVFGIFWLTYSKHFYFIQCLPSMPPNNADDCNLCNVDISKPCTKYRCESLGTACVFSDNIMIGNKNYTIADAQCIATENDGAAPWITNLEIKDLKGNLYTASPPSTTGPTTIDISQGGNPIPDGTQLMIKINLNEKSFCMWDIERTLNINEMDFPYESNVLKDELKQQFSVKQALPIYYIRCADAYGNANVAEYIFRFSATTGPDLTPPIIIGTDRDYNNKFASGVTQLPLWIYVNENATCKWAKEDKDYGAMDIVTQCQTVITMTGFKCMTNLTGLQPDVANYFYIRCQDIANPPNAMQESYPLTLYPAPPLNITSLIPEDGSIIKGCVVSGVEITVATAEGADNGKAICYWSNISYDAGMTRFTLTNAEEHKTNVSAVSQTIYVRCYDSALNIAQNKTTFTVIQDAQAPVLTRMYKESGLVIRTDEKATCAFNYRANLCDFAANDTLRAKEFSSSDGLTHTTPWQLPQGINAWYTKCYDTCDNGGKSSDPCIIIYPSDVD